MHRRNYFINAAAALSALCLANSINASLVDNFELLDQRGYAHELYYLSDASAVVLMAHASSCQEANHAAGVLANLAETYGSKGVEVRLLNSNLDDDRATIRAAMDAEENGLAVLIDDTQLIGESLGFWRAGETIVIDPGTWRTVYRGDIDGVAATLDAMLGGNSIPAHVELQESCKVSFPEQELQSTHSSISYTDTIAPLLIEKCLACHRPGGIGPWVMSDHNMVLGFSLMMREVLRTQRMPPWHADPHHGRFKNDRSLSIEEKQTLVHWIEAGAPRGEGVDPLANFVHDWPEWELGTPDVVIDIPAQMVPASGVVDYQYPTVTNPLDHDVWVRAADILPGDRAALHHVITTFRPPGQGSGRSRFGGRGSGGLGGYVPGSTGSVYPANTGRLLPARSTIRLQMHYTPYGRETTDQSQLGIYLHEEPPLHRLGGRTLINFRFRIPPHTKAHTAKAEHVFKNDVLVYSLLPHSHYRGKASNFVAFYPNGEEEILLSVPNYDFNWQTTYRLETPKILPAGTRLVHSTTWDNSSQNPANPDPNKEVRWGQQSWAEMLFGSVTYRTLTDVEKQSVAAD
ncbi:MAG TPA: redoxin domain-containing protein [Pseudomonadales bacterium]|nr:redoxin domain-containing protein [Pseudomonadales bacterium]